LPALAGLHQQGIRLRVRLGMPGSLTEELSAGALDLVVSTVRLSHKGLEFVPIFQEDFVLVANPTWAARLKTVNAEVLRQVPLLAYAEDLPILRRYWRQVFGVRLSQSASVILEDLRGLAQAAVAGAGVCVLPLYLVEELLAAGKLVKLIEPSKPPSNTLYLASRSTTVQPRVQFVRELIQHSL
jgi:DNA-binding transcriptional LysR family regulator